MYIELLFLEVTISFMSITLPWFRLFRILISRIAVIGNPSFSPSSFTFFNATKLESSRDRAMKTSPYVPSPTCSIFSYASTDRAVLYCIALRGLGPGESAQSPDRSTRAWK